MLPATVVAPTAKAGMSYQARETLAGVLVMVLAAGTGLTAWMGYGLYKGGQPSPGFFPFIASAVLFGLAACLLVKNAMTPAARRRQIEEHHMMLRRPIVLLSYGGVFLLSIALIEILGFVPCAAVLMLAYCKMIGNERVRWVTAILYSTLGSIAVYVLFAIVLKIELPKGILPL